MYYLVGAGNMTVKQLVQALLALPDEMEVRRGDSAFEDQIIDSVQVYESPDGTQYASL